MTLSRKNFGALLVVDLKHSGNFPVSKLNCRVNIHFVSCSKFPICIELLELLTSHLQQIFGRASVGSYHSNSMVYFFPIRGSFFLYLIEEEFQLIQFVLRQTREITLREDITSHISMFGEEMRNCILNCSTNLSFGLCLY